MIVSAAENGEKGKRQEIIRVLLVASTDNAPFLFICTCKKLFVRLCNGSLLLSCVCNFYSFVGNTVEFNQKLGVDFHFDLAQF